MKKAVGVSMVIVVIGALVSSFLMGSALAWDLYWSPVTTWTDNTAIEPEHLPMSYTVEWDGTSQPATTESSWPIPAPAVGHGIQHVARVKAATATGKESVWSDPFAWSSPDGTVPAVLGIGVR